MKEIYIDWAKSKAIAIYNPETNEVSLISHEDWAKLKSEIENLYVESGCPEGLLLGIQKVHVVDAKKVQEYREDHGFEKSDENDAVTLYKYIKETGDTGKIFVPKTPTQIFFREMIKTREHLLKAQVALKNLEESRIHEYGNNGHDVSRGIEKEIRKIEKAIQKHPIVKMFLSELERKLGRNLGIGYLTIAEIISIIGEDPKAKFRSASAMKRYFGVVPKDICGNSYNRRLKSIFYLNVTMQKNKDTWLGERFRFWHNYYRSKHPEKIVIDGKTKFNPSYISKMAIRRVTSEFLEAYYEIEDKQQKLF